MGMFGDLDVENAEDLNLKPDTYSCIVSSAEVGPTKDGKKTGLNLQYSINSGHKKGTAIFEWQRIPSESDEPAQTAEEKARSASYLKARMLSLGILESDINETEPKDLIGLEVLVKMVLNKKADDGSLKIAKIEPGNFSDNDYDGVVPAY